MANAVSMHGTAQETFSTQVVERSSGKTVEAQLVLDVTTEQIAETEALWAPFREASRNRFRVGEGTRPKDLDWHWGRKRLQYQPDAARVFGILVDKTFEGLVMISNKPVSSRRYEASHQKMLYVEYLETAPRNQIAYVGDAALYKGVGRELIFAAMSASADLGLGGRLALHSLSTAETFYRGFGFQDVGFDKRETLPVLRTDRRRSQESSRRREMKLLKPKPEVLARLDQLEEDNFVSAGTHRLEGTKSSARLIGNRQKVLVDLVRQKSRKQNGLRTNAAPGRAAVHTRYAEN